jgi:ribonuclease P protein component
VDTPAQIGLIVSRSVGGSVIRHRVARRLRAVFASRLGDVGPGDLVVIRALPAAAGASSATLAADLERALRRLVQGAMTAGAAS